MIAWLGSLPELAIWVRPAPSASLELSRSDLQTHIADFAGLGRSVPTDTDDLSRVNESVKIGLRQFYYAALVMGDTSPHNWSFLSPIATLYTEADTWQYGLPSDFGLLVGEITYANYEGPRFIRVRGEQYLREKRRTSNSTGYPTEAAVRVVGGHGDIGQPYELIFWPTPGAVYELVYRYEVTPDALTDANPYPLGGAMHAETIMQSCRAAADKIFNDNVGTEHQLFVECLRTSIARDRQAGAPERLGYLHDPGMAQRALFPHRADDLIPTVTVNGATIQ